MSSAQHLREFISQRLTAAAEEIFSEFEKTIVQYEEEIDRQRRLLDVTWKPRIKLPTIDLPSHYLCTEEEFLAYRELGKEDGICSLDQEEPEPPQIKEEQEELHTSQDKEQLVMKPEADTFMVTPVYEESRRNNPTPNSGQLFSQSSESQDHKGTDHETSTSVESKPNKRHYRPIKFGNNVDTSHMFEGQFNTDTSETSLKCDFCGKEFRLKCQLRKHRRIHTDEKLFSCKTCGKCFRCSSSLLTHIRIHTGVKPYHCKICGKSFTQKTHLSAHLKCHLDVKPYFCAMCDKSFRRSDGLLVHMRIHTGEKLYRCDTCGRSFTQNQHLTVHIRSHTGERPYPCKLCEKRFKDSATLRRHMRIHTNNKL